MKKLKRTEKCKLTERVLQFGEGNFLRGFVDWMIDKLNKEADFDCGVVIVQPLPRGTCEMINDQDGLYTLYLRGLVDGEAIEETRVVECVTRCINPYEEWEQYIECANNPDLRFIVSNTTEAGIEYIHGQMTFPARLTKFLKARYDTGLDGFILLPCELIDRNGDNLKKCVLSYAAEWELGDDFITWINNENHFTNTLVDRIVTGYPKDIAVELEEKYGYSDKVIDTAEVFHLWVIEGNSKYAEELPFHKYGMNVIWTDDVTPYKMRKVRILNGAHTMMVPAAFMCGHQTVGEALNDDIVRNFMRNGIFKEVIPTLDMPFEELNRFADDVVERFRNPFVKHYLTSIVLNSVSKFQVRVLPSILEYNKRNNELPKRLVFSLAALIDFYRNGEPNDNADIMKFMKSATTDEILSEIDYWDCDLSFLSDTVKAMLFDIETKGMRNAMGDVDGYNK
jgi:Mannitol-1-phosphate/altronate dehydrogenases